MSSRVLGIMMLVAGIALFLFGMNASDSVADTVTEGVTGRYTDKTMWYLIGGGVLAIGGAAMALVGPRNAARS
jgi:hypothetical protein